MNSLLKEIVRWQKKPAERRAEQVFIVEGIKMFRELPAERLLHVVLSESFRKQNASEAEEIREMTGAMRNVSFTAASDADFLRISDTKTPQGILAVARAYTYDEDILLSCRNGLYMMLENLQDPGNLGTILRASEAAGVTAVIMSRDCVDVYNPKVIRSTMGSFFRVPFVTVDDLKKTAEKISGSGGTVYAAHLKGSVCYDLPDYKKTTAFMIGNESKGLTDALTQMADAYIRIPMQGQVESLNAAMAATVLMFEAARQRR